MPSLGACTPAVLMVGVPVSVMLRLIANRWRGKRVARVNNEKEVDMKATNVNETPTGCSTDRTSTRMTLGTVCGVLSELTIGTAASAAATAFRTA